MPREKSMTAAFELARERYAACGVDVDRALRQLAVTPFSLHAWQGDDVGGFENAAQGLGGSGLAVTGGHPGKARTLEELRADLDQALCLIPGRHRVNLHAIYGDFGGRTVERDRIALEHFRSWIDWAGERGLGLDFNATCFAHPKAAGGFTLAHRDPGVRAFWVEHVRRCRAIAASLGQALQTPTVHNLWIPDGTKDQTPERLDARTRLLESLNAIYADDYPDAVLEDSVESKLFGIGSEAFVAGSHEFYLAWAVTHRKTLCLDMGHFHPTESLADKISALLLFLPRLLIHVSRGIRWDSDHVVVAGDELGRLMEEVVRAAALPRVSFALDYFDASLNRVGAWVIGARAAQKALLAALLEPTEQLRKAAESGDGMSLLAWMEESRTLPLGAVWDAFCLRNGVPPAADWLPALHDYERRVLVWR